MSQPKYEALGRIRTADAMSPRLLALSRPHHFSRETGTTESLFDYGDGIALLQHDSSALPAPTVMLLERSVSTPFECIENGTAGLRTPVPCGEEKTWFWPGRLKL